MATSPVNTRDLPVVLDVDVLVAGGGPGGLGAAVMAARAGVKVALVERFAFLGGMASAGEVHPFMSNHAKGVCLDKPVYVDWIRRMKEYLPPAHAQRGFKSPDITWEDQHISKDVAMLAAEDLCLEAGVQLLYHHTVVGAKVARQRLAALVLHSKSGFSLAKAKVFIDCTGDADVAALAGCECEQGGPSGHCQPMTLCFKLSHVDKEHAAPNEELQRLYAEAKKRGDIQCPRENVLRFNWIDNDVIHFNTTRVIKKSGTDGVQLSEAEIEARRQLRQILHFLRTQVKGYEHAQVHSIAHHIGVRETRRVRGLAYLTYEAFTQRQKFADAIARVSYPIDIHNPDGTGTKIEHIPDGEWYEIPYGCIVARDVKNLLVGGRPISVDHAIHSSMRVMPPACSVGQACGVAAAMAVQHGVTPDTLDGREVRLRLTEMGAWLG